MSWGTCGCFECVFECMSEAVQVIDGWLLARSRIIFFLEDLCVSMVGAVYICEFVFHRFMSGC